MKQLQFFKYATGAMILLNLLIIAFFLLTKPKPPAFPPHNARSNGFQVRAIDILKLDKQQHTTFLQSAKQHSQQMESINRQQRDLLKPYFHSIIDSTINIASETVLDEIQQLERNKIEATYQHFQQVKSILKNEQQADFKVFINNN